VKLSLQLCSLKCDNLMHFGATLTATEWKDCFGSLSKNAVLILPHDVLQRHNETPNAI